MRYLNSQIGFLFTMFLAAALPLQSQAEPQQIELPPTQVYTNQASQFQFPPGVAKFDRGSELTQYDPQARDISVPYNYLFRQTVVTVFVFPITGKLTTNTLPAKFANCKAEVVSAHVNAKLISEGRIQISPGGKKQDGLHAVFTFTDNFSHQRMSLRSEVFLFTHRQSFVLYRITYPVEMQSDAEPAMKTFMNELAWP